jgi:simple sugar transport system permease protein
MDAILQSILNTGFLFAILRVTTPILFPSLGALISNLAGVGNIGLEGIMLGAAFTGVLTGANALNNPTLAPFAALIGLVAGVGIGGVLALILAVFHLELGGDLVLAGFAINILGSAGTVAVMTQVVGDRASTSRLVSPQMPIVSLPFLKDVPLIGTALSEVFNAQNSLTWLAFLSVGVLWVYLYRTPAGRHLRAVGENPDAAASVGINVKRTRYQALLLSGVFGALGGLHLSMGYLSLFQRDMSAGRGFIALATPALGNNTPLGTALASVFFGLADALGIRLGTLQIPPEYSQMIPYAATVIALTINAVIKRRRLRRRTA